jgi:ABC-type polysaccharide/polyol phosphate export permease
MTVSQASNPPFERWNRAGRLVRAHEEIRDLLAYRDLLRSLVHRDLTVRYKRSPLGFLWTMLHPLILMTIFTIVFSALFRFEITHFAIYFLASYIGWTFFDQTIVQSMGSVMWNGPLMKRVRVPRSIFVISTTLSGLVNLTLSLGPLVLLMLFTGAPIRWTFVFLPVSFLIIGTFTLGIALALSSLSIYFADVREMYQAISPAIMYLTPIVYPLSIVPERALPVVRANPLLYLLQLFRAPIYEGALPDPSVILIASGAALLALVAGWAIFRRLAPGYHIHL